MAIDTIVVAVGRGEAETERTEQVADAVADVALPTDADVVVLHVFREEELDELVEQLDYNEAGEDEPGADVVARRHTAARAIGEHLQDAGIEFEVRGTVGGDTGTAVVAFADEADADLVVIGGRKRTPAGKAVFGSTGQQVLLNANCPVTYVRHR